MRDIVKWRRKNDVYIKFINRNAIVSGKSRGASSALSCQGRRNGILQSAEGASAFRKHQVSDYHLHPSNGYGYDDEGRDNLERVYAEVFGAERHSPTTNYFRHTCNHA